jgi:tetratricopeptide (TPR) repeat protein
VALGVLGWSTWIAGQEEQAAEILEESLAVARTVGEPWVIGHALLHCVFRVANSAAIGRAGERARAWAAGEEGLRHFKVAGDRMCTAMMELHLGRIALYEGNHGRARAAFVACLPMLRALGWQSNAAEGLVRLADVAREQGDQREAVALYTEALTLYRQLGDQWLPAVAWVRSRLAALALEWGDRAVAETHLAESLAIARDTGRVGAPERPPELAGVLEVSAALAAAQGARLRATRLAAAAAALRMQLNRPPTASEQATLERTLTGVRRALGAEQQAQAWAAGQSMTPEQAIAHADDGLASAHGTRLQLPTTGEDEAGGEQASRTPQGAQARRAGTEDILPPMRERRRTVGTAQTGPRVSRPKRQAWALEQLRTAGPLTPRAYASALAVSVDTALRDLRELVDRGAIEATGTTRDRRYVLTGGAVGPAIHRTAH